jgi:hypothetical protein
VHLDGHQPHAREECCPEWWNTQGSDTRLLTSENNKPSWLKGCRRIARPGAFAQEANKQHLRAIAATMAVIQQGWMTIDSHR